MVLIKKDKVAKFLIDSELFREESKNKRKTINVAKRYYLNFIEIKKS